MRFPVIQNLKFFESALGALLVATVGLILGQTALGEPWGNASYDYLFRLGERANTNQLTIILMDNAAFDQFHQTRGQPWDRGLHAKLLDRLADDGCALVVFDAFFRAPQDARTDAALAIAMQRQRQVLLMAEQAEIESPRFSGAKPVPPAEIFLQATNISWGVAWLNPDLDSVVRRHWPFPSPGPYPSLPWQAANVSGANLSEKPEARWLRYYGNAGPGTKMSYAFALSQPTNYFHNQVVFIGTQPKSTLPDGEPDEFATPYTRWTGESMGGVQINAAAFLNLMNGDWLRRQPMWLEGIIFALSGLALGGGLCRLKMIVAGGVALFFLAASVGGAIIGSYVTNYWFPWLIISGAQIPCALGWTLAVKIFRTVKSNAEKNHGTVKPPKTPGYEIIQPAIGQGAYGQVWLARNKAGEWRALKVIYLANFNRDAEPYEREFDGVSRYHPISHQHPGLLRVDFVSPKQNGYFYYVMELGDSLIPGWENDFSKYKTRDLVSERAGLPNNRLPVRACLRLGLELTEALEVFHQHGLTHRDIKPQNIIFVNGKPKFADLGLISEIRPTLEVKTIVGTPGFMPPPPECPGTPRADIFALGMVLYVLSTGRAPCVFPEISDTLITRSGVEDFFALNQIILKACQPEAKQRYASAQEMHTALRAAFE